MHACENNKYLQKRNRLTCDFMSSKPDKCTYIHMWSFLRHFSDSFVSQSLQFKHIQMYGIDCITCTQIVIQNMRMVVGKCVDRMDMSICR